MAVWNKEKLKSQAIAEPQTTPVEATPTVPEDYLAKAEHFRSLWHQKLQEEHEVKDRIRELKQARQAIERRQRVRDRER